MQNIKVVIVPSDLDSIGENNFRSKKLEELYIQSVKNKCTRIMERNTKLQIMYYGKQVDMYASCEFLNSKHLDTTPMFRDGLMAIDSRAFTNCEDIKEVSLPDSTLYIHISVFEGV